MSLAFGSQALALTDHIDFCVRICYVSLSYVVRLLELCGSYLGNTQGHGIYELGLESHNDTNLVKQLEGASLLDQLW